MKWISPMKCIYDLKIEDLLKQKPHKIINGNLTFLIGMLDIDTPFFGMTKKIGLSLECIENGPSKVLIFGHSILGEGNIKLKPYTGFRLLASLKDRNKRLIAGRLVRMHYSFIEEYTC